MKKRKEDLFAPTLRVTKADWIVPKGVIPQNGKTAICDGCGITVGKQFYFENEGLCGMCEAKKKYLT